MALAVTKTFQDISGKVINLFGTITASGNYTTNGDTLSFAGLVPGKRPPISVQITSQGGYVYGYVPSTTVANGLMKVFVNAGTGANLPLGEHTQAAYNAAVTADIITFEATFPYSEITSPVVK